MSASTIRPDVFYGVIAIELRDGKPPQHAAMPAKLAGDLAVLMGRDLTSLVPQVASCDIALLTTHFDPAEVLRSGWPQHRNVESLLKRAPEQGMGARLVGFGSDAQGGVHDSMRADPALLGGGLRVMPFVLHGPAVALANERLEYVLFDHGMAEADAAMLIRDGLGADAEHIRYMSLHDLLSVMAMQFQNMELDGLWALLETALLEPESAYALDVPPEPLVRYGEGQMHIALLDPATWQQRNAPEETDPAKLERGFAHYQMRQRQYAAVCDAHGMTVNFEHGGGAQ